MFAWLPVNVSFWLFYKTSWENVITVCLIFNITYCILQHDNTLFTAFTSNILGIFTGFRCEIMGSTFMYLGNCADASNFARSGHTVPLLFSIKSFPKSWHVSVWILPVSCLNRLTHSMCKVIMIPSRSSLNARRIISIAVEQKSCRITYFKWHLLIKPWSIVLTSESVTPHLCSGWH